MNILLWISHLSSIFTLMKNFPCPLKFWTLFSKKMHSGQNHQGPLRLVLENAEKLGSNGNFGTRACSKVMASLWFSWSSFFTSGSRWLLSRPILIRSGLSKGATSSLFLALEIEKVLSVLSRFVCVAKTDSFPDFKAEISFNFHLELCYDSFWPRATLEGPKRGFVVVVLFCTFWKGKKMCSRTKKVQEQKMFRNKNVQEQKLLYRIVFLSTLIWVLYGLCGHVVCLLALCSTEYNIVFRSESNRRLRATVGQNSSRVQMASACHVCAAVLVHVARRRRLDSDLDERSLRQRN